jgi:hypothetical protein
MDAAICDEIAESSIDLLFAPQASLALKSFPDNKNLEVGPVSFNLEVLWVQLVAKFRFYLLYHGASVSGAKQRL